MNWQKFRQAENRVLDFLVRHYLVILVVVGTILALFLRYKFLRFESIDYTDFLLPWFNDLKNGGGLAAIANYTGDYNAPYVTILALLTYIPINPLYLIKAVSILFDIVLAISAAYLVYTIKPGPKRKYYVALAYLITLFLPQVFLNSACWGQCDAIYTSFCFFALACLFRKKYTWSFIWLGVAFAFKLQFVFILPIFLIVYLVERKFSILNFLIIPLTNFVLCLPAIFAGRSVWDCFMVYFNQTQTYSYRITLNYINIHQIFNGNPAFWNWPSIILAVIICALAVFWILNHHIKLTTEKLLELAIWFAIVLPFVLPSMHERYLYMGEILAVIYYLVYRKHGLIILLINTYAWITYTAFLAPNDYFSYHYLALVEVFAIAGMTKNVFQEQRAPQLLEHKKE